MAASNIGSEHTGHIGAAFKLPVVWWGRKRGMEALLQAASEDTREDPVFDDPDDLDFDEDMAQLMREV